jgi:hypothetical protein
MPQDNAKSGCWGWFSKLKKKLNKIGIAAIPPEIAGSVVDTLQALVGSSQIDELNAKKVQCLDLATKINEVRENLRKMYEYANDFTANLDFENVNQEQPRDIDSKIENINTNDSLEELNQLWDILIIQYSKSKEEHNTVADKLLSIATENTSNICINNRPRLTTQSNNLNLNERSNIMPQAQQILEAIQTEQMPEQLQLTQMSLVPSGSSHQAVIQYGHYVSSMLQQTAIANRMQNNKLIETIQKATGKLHILVYKYRYLRDFITSNNLSIDIQEEPSLDIPNASNRSMQELKARLINIVNLINVYKVLNNSMENDIAISDLDGDEVLDPENVHEIIYAFGNEAGYDLIYQSISGDGNCLYNAVALYCELDQQTLRNIVAGHIRNNLGEYQDLINVLEGYNGRNVNEYLIDIEDGKEWADNLEIAVLMKILDRPIIIVESNNRIRNLSNVENNNGLIFNGEPIFVYYNGHNHYDALIRRDDINISGIDIFNKLKQGNINIRKLGKANTTNAEVISCTSPAPKIVPNREEIPNANNTLHFRYSSSSSADNIQPQTSGNYANASTTLESKDNDRVGASKPGNTV